jgi:hypothetical protein
MFAPRPPIQRWRPDQRERFERELVRLEDERTRQRDERTQQTALMNLGLVIANRLPQAASIADPSAGS